MKTSPDLKTLTDEALLAELLELATYRFRLRLQFDPPAAEIIVFKNDWPAAEHMPGCCVRDEAKTLERLVRVAQLLRERKGLE
jgi:hypothetical protein